MTKTNVERLATIFLTSLTDEEEEEIFTTWGRGEWSDFGHEVDEQVKERLAERD